MKKHKQNNPLIPMMAITGDLSREQIEVILQRYMDKGITQFLMYPRDGCDVPYMSERWLTICRDFIETAAFYGMEVWLYDEFNWPSGTCFGKVMEENPSYTAQHVLVENGVCRIEKTHFTNGRIPDRYADILNPDAVECFIRLTHEVYYKHFAPWFGTVIQGIFTDEPSFLYYNHPAGHHLCNGGYPYFKDAEILYGEKTGRDLFADMAEGNEDFLCDYYTLLGQRFREVYVDRLADWCKEHGILLTGHLMFEHDMHGAVSSNGDTIHVLRGFTLPGMDEISTNTSIEKAEWLTFGTVQAAVRQSENGGLVETFALGPTDIPPARIEQMIWLEAMFGIDHYLLAVAAVDARGNVKKNGWYNPICYTNPWFEGFPELGLTAAEAAAWAQKTIAAEVYVRLPIHLTQKYLFDEKKKFLTQQRLITLLQLLTRRQVQWLLLTENEPAPAGIPVLEITDVDDFSAEALADSLPARTLKITDAHGELPDNLFLREFTDGSAVILDLEDTGIPRKLFIHEKDANAEILLNGRGRFLLDPQRTVLQAVHPDETCTEVTPVFRLMTDRPNTLRCGLWQSQTSYTFRVDGTLENIRMLSRAYLPGGQLMLDGTVMDFPSPADALTPGLAELYRSSAPFTLTPGEHTVSITETARSEMFLPSCFLCGHFAGRYQDNTDVLYPMPETVSIGQLSRDILPQYAGQIILETVLEIPENVHTLSLECCDLYTRVYLGGIRLEKQPGWNRFTIPEIQRGRTLVLRIEQFTSIAPVLGRYESIITGPGDSKAWFPRKYEKCGIESLTLIGTR
ncbi:MAG: hypothetical protein E7631_11310 [Ruminococcaceae bacterium]|nr:hypothetical protein [Oscillospiraceae bacterium]